eukprot:UN25900
MAKTNCYVLPQRPSLEKYEILNDGVNVLAQYSDGIVRKWNLTTFTVTKTWSDNADFEQLCDEHFIEKRIPCYFSVERGMGNCVVVYSKQDFEKGITTIDDKEVNLGQNVCKHIFSRWHDEEIWKNKLRIDYEKEVRALDRDDRDQERELVLKEKQRRLERRKKLGLDDEEDDVDEHELEREILESVRKSRKKPERKRFIVDYRNFKPKRKYPNLGIIMIPDEKTRSYFFDRMKAL